MKNSFVRGFESWDSPSLIMKNKEIRLSSTPFAHQVPIYKDRELVCCSYICDGYKNCYSDSGVLFESNTPIIYVAPDDSRAFMRSGNWIPWYENFLFKSVEEMLDKYPNPEYFQKDLKKLFESLSPTDIYKNAEDKESAERLYRRDLFLFPNYGSWYNEVAFEHPVKIQNPVIFNSKEKMIDILSK